MPSSRNGSLWGGKGESLGGLGVQSRVWVAFGEPVPQSSATPGPWRVEGYG